MSVLRTVWVTLVGAIATAVLATPIIVMGWIGHPAWLAKLCAGNTRRWAKTMLWAAGAKVTVEGAERVVGEETRILVANHESWFDVFALCAHLPDGYRFAIKKELERVPFFGGSSMACGHIYVDRHNRQSAIQSIERAKRLSGSNHGGIVILFFPEGTRSTDGTLLPFKKGAFVLALQLSVPVIPVAVLGGRQIMPKHGKRIHPGRMKIVVGEPIPVGDLSFESRDALLARSREAIIALRGGEGPTPAP